jgi:ribosome-binding factor A
MEGKRSTRVADLVQKEISDILMRSIKDPRIGFVTITRVSVSEDCRVAKIYFSIMGTDEERKETLSGLESAKGFIRKELGSRIRLRYTPELIFLFDPSIEYAIHIEEVIQQIHGKKESDEP